MTLGQQQDEIAKVVADYFDKYGKEYLLIDIFMFQKEHVIEIGTSILCTKWGVGYPGGSFAQAVVNNDLAEAFRRADDINIHCIRFYVMLMYNVGAPTSLFQ